MTTRLRIVAPIVLAVLAPLAACATRRAPLTVDVFAPDVVAGGSVYRGAFTPDGRELYFFRRMSQDPRREEYRIFVSRRQDGGWSPADTVRLGAPASDLYPAIDPTGRYLVFASYRPAPGDTSARTSASIWIAERQGDGWSEPRLAREATAPGHYHAQLVFDGRGHLNFNRQTADYRTKLGEFEARLVDGELRDVQPSRDWQELLALRGDLHLWETTPGHDGSYRIVVASVRDSATGRPRPPDLYISFRDAGGWSPLKRVDALASAGTENFVFYGPGGDRLYFVRDFREIRSVALAPLLKQLR